MNYETALKLKEARFPQSLDDNAEYYVTPTILIRRKDIFGNLYLDGGNTDGRKITTNLFVYKPRLEDFGTGDFWPNLLNAWFELNGETH